MSIFASILAKLRGHSEAAAAPVTTTGSSAPISTSGASAAPGAVAPPASVDASAKTPTASASAPAQSGTAPQAMSAFDVSGILDGLAAKSKEKLDWKHSIVDLMKLLDLDSSLTARKELAKELNYSGDTGDSAAMNMWLHKQVMQKLAANGGKLPADLAH